MAILSWKSLKEWAAGLFKPAPKRDALGDRGENVAARHLRNQGYKIIMRNFRCDSGEIDIIAKDRATLVFCEVKTRVDDQSTPEDQVNNVKQHQITKAARFYLSRYGVPQPPARFDVIAIVWPPGRPPQIRHTTDAFGATF
jgi:putative endonuclease